MRVEQLATRAGISVDTVRYYQSKGLLDPPRREGRVAWYGPAHLERLARIRSLQGRGFTLATIVRLVSGELDAADEALVGEVTGAGSPSGPAGAESGVAGVGPGTPTAPSGDDGTFTLEELAGRTGVPLALLKALEAENLLIPRRVGPDDRYTSEDVQAARAGLLLLEWGVPLTALLELSRRHHAATEEVAREAVSMFSTYVRLPIREQQSAGEGADVEDGADGAAVRLVQAYHEILAAVNTLVGHHFTRALLRAALDHVEQVGSDAEREALWHEVGLAVARGRDGGATDGGATGSRPDRSRPDRPGAGARR